MLKFKLIYNRFADMAYFFIITCSVFRIRALKRMNEYQLAATRMKTEEVQTDDMEKELSPKKFPFHEYHEYIKE